MTSPSDNQQPHDDAKVAGPRHPEYEILGSFEPRDAKRILKRLEEEHLSFELGDYHEIRQTITWLRRYDWVRIYVHPEHKQKAEAVVFDIAQP